MTLQSPESPAQPVITAHGIGKKFRGTTVLDSITLDVHRAEIFGLLGPDGAGKTTLMQIFAAILNPSEGNCRVLGFDTVREDAAVNAAVGYLAQGFTLYDRLSVDENLAFSARIRGVSATDLKQRAKELLGMAGLLQFRDRRAGHLSGGMRKKLSLCAALVHRPLLLLLDELSLGVDPLSRREMWDMLRSFRQEGTTIVLTTPYMDEAAHCDRLGFLSQGKLVATGDLAALLSLARSTTFSLDARNVGSALGLLQGFAGVLNVRRSGNVVRFQIRDHDGLPTDLADSLANLGTVTSVDPSLEDAFILLGQAERPIEPRAPTTIERLTGPEPVDLGAGPAVDLRNVTCTFGDFVAVDNVSLQVERGEVFGFLGPNGAGKTTLIRALCGLLRPSDGEISVAGIDVRKTPRRVAQRIGYMSQRFSLYPDMTSSENLMFFGGAYGLRGSAMRKAVEQTSFLVGLRGLLDKKVSDLSGAVRQRLALACSILHRPNVLFLDEPTSGVDPLSRNRFWTLIRQLADSGVTVFVTTHYLEEAHHCDRIGLMARGRLLAAGTLDELRAGIDAPQDFSFEEVFIRYVRRAHDAQETAAV